MNGTVDVGSTARIQNNWRGFGGLDSAQQRWLLMHVPPVVVIKTILQEFMEAFPVMEGILERKKMASLVAAVQELRRKASGKTIKGSKTRTFTLNGIGYRPLGRKRR